MISPFSREAGIEPTLKTLKAPGLPLNLIPLINFESMGPEPTITKIKT